MLNRRTSFKNQTCPVLKKSDVAPKPTVVATTLLPTSLPHSHSNLLAHRTNNVGHQEYGRDPKPLNHTQSTNSVGHHDYGHDDRPLATKVTQRTNSVGHHDYGHDQHPLARSQSTKVTQRTNSVGNHDYGHDQHPLARTQSTKVTERINSVGHHDYGHDQHPLARTQTTEVTQRTNSVGHHDYGHDQHPLARTQSNVILRTNSVGSQGYRHDTQSTKVTLRTNSVGHQEYQGVQTKLPEKLKPIIQFPVSPELDPMVVGEGITNANHPQHRMIHVNLPIAFTCMGCKEYGAGPRFTCQQCNFELHDFCALAPPVLKAHPLHSQHQLVFNAKPGKGGILRSKCDVCGKAARGYLFHCSACSYQLHPSCAMLSAKIKFPTHPHPLLILPTSTNSLIGGDPGELPCAECKRKRSGQVYRCTVCDYYLHAVCAKNMVNGLHDNGIKGLDKPSMLGVAAKIATHVVVGFMGGLIEGLGEGLGEAITQNFVKGRCNSGKRSLYPSN